MTEKECEALYEPLVAAHKILPGETDCAEKEAEFREKIRTFEKAVRERQKKAATSFERGEAAMRVLIAVFLFLDFTLACFFAAQLFHL